MPTFYNFKQDGNTYSFDDVFIPVDAFRQGNLWTWGRNNSGGVDYSGQLGDNTTTDRSTPVTTFAGGNNWKSVNGIGFYYSAVLKTDGTIWGWGGSFWGYFGNNVQTQQISSPVPIFGGTSGWKSIFVGEDIFAIKTDGTLWTSGYNGEGQLGINNTDAYRATPVTTFAGGTNWKQVSSGRVHTAAIKTDGTLWTWGRNLYGQLGINDTTDRSTPVTTFAGGSNWKQVSCGWSHTTAIKTDGTLWTCGYNVEGQLGTNDVESRSTPVTTFAGGSNWKSVAVAGGWYHTAAIKTDGTLWIWGNNTYGGLGTNDTTHRSTPVTTFAGGTNWKQVGTGYRHTVAIKTDGTLWTWGFNNYGQLGINDTTSRLTPVTTFAGGTNWKQVSCGVHHTAAIEYIDSVL